MKRIVVVSVVALLTLALIPAHAAVTTVYVNGAIQDSQDAWVNVSMGLGCFVHGCGPGTGVSADGTGTAVALIEYSPPPPAEGYDVVVAIKHMTISGTEVWTMEARGIGSDGMCHGITAIDAGESQNYFGVAIAPLATLDDPIGPCVATDIWNTPDPDGDTVIISDVA